ncbi:MAG: hypothetical protein WC379_18480 [Methanoregula sp.]|jgi:hypothetical protein
MAATFDIKADVINIHSDNPLHKDLFFVDTNVWYWYAYSQASVTAARYQVNEYPAYVKKIKSVNSQMMRSNLILAELAHIIEDTEYRIFYESNRLDPKKFAKKEYRHNHPSERKNVVHEIENVWETVKNITTSIPLNIDDPATEIFMRDVKSYGMDGYDLFNLDLIRKQGIPILTDDGDFATVPGITVFTANNNVIDAARDCGKLIMR